MQDAIHPAYRPVVFRDRSGGLSFLTRSTRTSTETVEWEDGRSYPVVDVDVSVASHPWWTGRGRVLDTEGRVEAFERRYGRGRSQAHRSPAPDARDGAGGDAVGPDGPRS